MLLSSPVGIIVSLIAVALFGIVVVVVVSIGLAITRNPGG